MDGDIVLRLLELAEPGASFEDAGGRRILRDAADEILAARACAEMMLQGTGQKLGEEWARRVMDEHYPPRWIPVDERLPTAGEEVLSFSENYGHVVARLDGGKWYAIYTDTETGEPWIRGEVTHWMPLPEPPEVK